MTVTSTQVAGRQSAAPEVTPRFAGMKVTQARVVRSEWTKFRSLRSSYITLLVALVLMVGLGALISAVTANHWDQADAARRLSFNPVATSLDGVTFAQLAVGVLGVLLISGEYATGMIRASLTAVPRRLPVLWAKITVFAVIVGVSFIIASFVAFFIGQSLLASKNLDTTLSAAGSLRMVIGAGVYVVLVGIIGLGLGGLLRNTAAAISSLVAMFFVIPPILGLLPSTLSDNIGPYLPSTAGEAFWGHPDGRHLQPWNGLGVLLLWTVLAVGLAALRLARDDA